LGEADHGGSIGKGRIVYTVAEAVDQVQMVYGAIPKKIFTR